ncbi:MAG: SUMF1/EgtB/PvdO family nonheme iron enzyme [Planctomycetaceae bacterium]|nr:SUMF1/EgtB/PvdO family nonheme iron enzyme [Planctomycetaceae bacterium]
MDPLTRELWDLHVAATHPYDPRPILQRGLRELREKLPELNVTVGDQPLKWNSLKLPLFVPRGQTEATCFQAFRFRSPLDQPADLHWSYAVPQATGRWSILRINGEMSGFEFFERLWNLKIPALALPPGNTVVLQELIGGKILPGEEYVIWYHPHPGAAPDFHAALRLTPVGTFGAAMSAQELAKSIGLSVEHHEFPKTTEGLESAYAVAARLVEQGGSQSIAVSSVLRSVAPLIPEIQVATQDGPPVWNHVAAVPTRKFQAVRFRCPLQQPADLHWCHVVAGEPLSFGVAALDGGLRNSGEFCLEVDCPIAEIPHPQQNLATLQAIPDGQFQPGREYVVWFAASETDVPDVDLTVRLSPANSFSATPKSQSIGKALGLEIPPTPSAERVASALRRCRVLVDQGRMDSHAFQRLIQFAQPGLPTLDSGAVARWHTLELNQNGRDFAAFRIPVEAGTNYRILAAIARPVTQPVQAGFVYFYPDKEWNGIRAAQRRTQPNVVSAGLPNENVVEVNHYDQWKATEDSSLVLAIAPIGDKPVTVQAALDVTPSTISENFRGVADSLEVMGLGGARPDQLATAVASKLPYVFRLQFLDADTVIAGASDGTLNRWQRDAVVESQSEQVGGAVINELAVAPDRTVIAAGDPHWKFGVTRIVLCDPESVAPQKYLELPEQRSIGPLAFSPDSRRLLVCDPGESHSRNSAVCVWDLAAGGPPTIRDFPKGTVVRAAQWLPDGQTLVTVGNQREPLSLTTATAKQLANSIPATGEICFRNANSLEVMDRLTEDGYSEWTALAVSGNGERLAAASRMGFITIVDLATRKPMASLTQETGLHLSLSADGRRLATLSAQHVTVWEVDRARALYRTSMDEPKVTAVTLSPNGLLLVLGGVDRLVRFVPLDADDPQVDRTFAGKVLTDSLGQRLMPIPAGEFLMGTREVGPGSAVAVAQGQSRPENEYPAHRVRITRPFHMGETEVTVAQFRAFVDATGYRTTAETSGKGGSHVRKLNQNFTHDPPLNWRNPGFPQGDDHPVVQVSQHDAKAFCNWLSKKENAKCRLPTEAEWEYACRAGTTTRWYCGDGANHLHRCGNLMDQSLTAAYGDPGSKTTRGMNDGWAYTAPVRSFVPNAFGLYDLYGNAFEWCSDHYDPTYYSKSPVDDPPGATAGANYAQRGGCFFHYGGIGRSAYRDQGPADQVQSGLGFRIVREMNEVD